MIYTLKVLFITIQLPWCKMGIRGKSHKLIKHKITN